MACELFANYTVYAFLKRFEAEYSEELRIFETLSKIFYEGGRPIVRALEIHLGEATTRLAKRYGGFGGGRKRAGGASIPRKDCIEFIKDLEIKLC